MRASGDTTKEDEMAHRQILGKRVENKVTGFTGVATGICVYLNGCVSYLVRPKVKKGDSKNPEGVWMDDNMLKVLGPGPVKPSLLVELEDRPFTGGERADYPPT
jgi:hypothetical protein